MEQQMHKQFYCPVDKCKTMFISHATRKGVYICQSCRYTTSNPIENLKMPTPKKSDMDTFWDNMAKKSRGEKPVGIRSR